LVVRAVVRAVTLGDVGRFHRWARLYDRLMLGTDADALAAGLALADRPVSRVLDVGGGSGRGVRAVDATERVVVDAARGMLRQARGHGLATVQGDAGTLPVRDDTADAVIIVDALHHMPAVDDVLGEARRVLRPGGVLVVREFDPTTVRGRGLVAAEWLVRFESQFWPPDVLADRVNAAGFDAHVPDRGFGYTVAGVVPA
jgi:ubiquinone/menaquinone biosynthesis C-methylase UbiE